MNQIDNVKHNIIFIYGKSHTNHTGKIVTETWDKFTKRFLSPERQILTKSKFLSLTSGERSQIKNSSGWIKLGSRANDKTQAITSRTGLSLDIDSPKDGGDWVPAEVKKRLGHVNYVIHESASSSKDARKFRVFVPFANEIDLDQFRALSTLVADIIGLDAFDMKATVSPHQLMYLPIQFQEDDYYCEVNDVGHWLEASLFLDTLWEHHFGAGPWTDISTWPKRHSFAGGENARRRAIDAEGMQANPYEKPGVIGQFCRAFDIHAAIKHYLSEVWEYDSGGRYTYRAGTSIMGGAVYKYDDQSTEDLYLYSHHGSDPYHELLLNSFDLVRVHKFGHLDVGSRAKRTESLPSFEEMRQFLKTDKTFLAEREKQQTAELVDYQNSFVLDEKDKLSGQFNEGDGGKKPTEDRKPPTFDYSPNGFRMVTLPNLCAWIDWTLEGAIAINTRTDALVLNKGFKVIKPYPVKNPVMGEPVTEDFIINLKREMEYIGGKPQNHWQKDQIPKESIRDAMRSIAEPFCPVRRYLDGLPKWDGKKRIRRFWIDHALAKDTKFNRVVTEDFFVAAVCIAMRPGHPYGSVPVLVGEEGIGKSAMMAAAMPCTELYAESPILHRGDKEFIESTDAAWVVEIAELESVTKSQGEVLKRIITVREHAARLAYGRSTTKRPAQLVMFGTTNNPGFMHIAMGERRWLPVLTNPKPTDLQKRLKRSFETINKDRHQLWAEALHRAKKNDFRMPRTHTRKAIQESYKKNVNKSQSDRTTRITAAVKAFLDTKQGRTCYMEVKHKIGLSDNTGARAVETEIVRKAMIDCGWIQKGKLTTADGVSIPHPTDPNLSLSCARQRAWEKDVFEGY